MKQQSYSSLLFQSRTRIKKKNCPHFLCNFRPSCHCVSFQYIFKKNKSFSISFCNAHIILIILRKKRAHPPFCAIYFISPLHKSSLHESRPSSWMSLVTIFTTSLPPNSAPGFFTFSEMRSSTNPLSLATSTPIRAQPRSLSHPSTSKPRPNVSNSIAPQNSSNVYALKAVVFECQKRKRKRKTPACNRNKGMETYASNHE